MKNLFRLGKILAYALIVAITALVVRACDLGNGDVARGMGKQVKQAERAFKIGYVEEEIFHQVIDSGYFTVDSTRYYIQRWRPQDTSTFLLDSLEIDTTNEE